MRCSSTLRLEIRLGLELGFQDSRFHDSQFKSVLWCDYKTTGLSGTFGFQLVSLVCEVPPPSWPQIQLISRWGSGQVSGSYSALSFGAKFLCPWGERQGWGAGVRAWGLRRMTLSKLLPELSHEGGSLSIPNLPQALYCLPGPHQLAIQEAVVAA